MNGLSGDAAQVAGAKTHKSGLLWSRWRLLDVQLICPFCVRCTVVAVVCLLSFRIY